MNLGSDLKKKKKKKKNEVERTPWIPPLFFPVKKGTSLDSQWGPPAMGQGTLKKKGVYT